MRGARDRHERAVGCGGRETCARRARVTRTAKSCGPDAAVLASSSLRSKLLRSDGGKRAVHRGEHEVSRNPSRRESRDASAGPVCSCAFFCATLHTRPRVQRAPGFPCALLLSRAANRRKSSGASRRENARACSISTVIVRESGRSSIPEMAVMESIGRGVLDPRMRGDDNREWSGSVHHANGWASMSTYYSSTSA